MVYKIMFKDPKREKRGNRWDSKKYKTIPLARKEIAKQVKIYKKSKYVKHIKPKHFYIRKVEENPVDLIMRGWR